MKVSLVICSGLYLLGMLGLTLFVSPVAAQVFDSGPSDSALFDTVINIPSDMNVDIPRSIGGDGFTTQINVSEGIALPAVEINSGVEVNIIGGYSGIGRSAFSGSEINMSAGQIGTCFRSHGVVNITGGTIGQNFRSESGSVTNISGGSTSNIFRAFAGSEVTISGGSLHRRQFGAEAGSDVELIGGEFQLNGEAYNGSTLTLGAGDIFSGTLADGSTFIFSSISSSIVEDVKLTSVVLPTLGQSPIVVSTPNPNLPSGLRPGQVMTLQDGGELGVNFHVVDATLNIEGGSLGDDASVIGGVANITGGSVGDDFGAFGDSVVNIGGGSVGRSLFASSGSVVNISGGSLGNSFFAGSDSVVNISGGSLDHSFSVGIGSEVNISGGSVGAFSRTGGLGSVFNISGGSVGDFFLAFPDSVLNISGGTIGTLEAAESSRVNLFGSDFILDGVPLDDSLAINNAFTIVDRDVTLSGLLEDGSAFSFDLNSVPVGDFFSDNDLFHSDATLTVTLVASNGLLGDVNLDGVVDFFDIAPFIAILADQTFQFEADIDGDQDVDFFDIAPFIALLAGQG